LTARHSGRSWRRRNQKADERRDLRDADGEEEEREGREPRRFAEQREPLARVAAEEARHLEARERERARQYAPQRRHVLRVGRTAPAVPPDPAANPYFKYVGSSSAAVGTAPAANHASADVPRLRLSLN
jgi:hypothetical protein